NLVGSCAIHSLSPDRDSGEVAVAINQAYWGLGIGSQALRLLVELGFRQGLRSLTAVTQADNERAAPLFLATGFVEYPDTITRSFVLHCDEFMAVPLTPTAP